MMRTEPAAVYQQPAEEVIAALGSDVEHGLTTERLLNK
jgi:hypothetical protein